MNEINGTVTSVEGKRLHAHVQTAIGEIIVEFDDFRIAATGLKVGDYLSVLNVRRYPEPENGRVIFYIGDDTSVWVNGAHLPILPD